jgi:TPP-dependent pyruvate/acetoin dehydrogenase alpha subunit
MKEFLKNNSELTKEIFKKLLLIRITEETIAERYSDQKMRCPTHLCSGQEAVAGVVCSILKKEDFVISTHRAHGHYLAKGGALNSMIAEIYGKSTGCSMGKGGSMHLIDKSVNFMGSTAIVGGTISVGVGLGLSIQLKKTDQISCVFFGDGATEEGVFYESINFAVLRKLPVLFVCEDNMYSVYSPKNVRQPDCRTINNIVQAMGCEEYVFDGNDAVAMVEKLKPLLETQRKNPRPIFIKCNTYRWREHCGPNFDNDLGYRTIEEYELWLKKDPVIIMKKKLIEFKIMNEAEYLLMVNEIKSKIFKAFEFAEKSPFPETNELYTDIYA